MLNNIYSKKKINQNKKEIEMDEGLPTGVIVSISITATVGIGILICWIASTVYFCRIRKNTYKQTTANRTSM